MNLPASMIKGVAPQGRRRTVKIGIGKIYKKDEPIATLDLNLEDLYWVQSLVPFADGFRKELQEGIDAIEKFNSNMAEGYGLSIVVVES